MRRAVWPTSELPSMSHFHSAVAFQLFLDFSHSHALLAHRLSVSLAMDFSLLIHLGLSAPRWAIYDRATRSDLGHALIYLCTLPISSAAVPSTALSCFISLSTFPILPKLALLKCNVFSFPFCCGFDSPRCKHDYY